MPSALEGLKVLDLSTGFAAAWCGRLFADFGATVAFHDPHPLRQIGPFSPTGVSVPATAALANKFSFLLDAEDKTWINLFAAADIIIDDAPARSNARQRIDTLAADNDRAIHVVITPHGLSGERASWPGNDLTASARSGWAAATGLATKAPLKQSGYQASYQAGTLAFGAAISALLYRLHGGIGQVIDVAVDDVSVASFAPGILRSLYNEEPMGRRSIVDVTSGPVPVRDGYFALTLTRPHFWQGAAQLLGLNDLANDDRLQSTASRNANKHLFVQRLQDEMTRWAKADLFEALSSIPVVAGPVFTMDELTDNSHLAARSFFTDVGGIRFVGAPFRSSETPFSLRRGVPEPGADLENILKTWTETSPSIRTEASAGAQDGPLTGYRGVVLTQAWSGTFATELAALLGAEVIQVEARSRFDSWRGGGFDAPLAPAFKERSTAKNSWNCESRFNSVNLNKKSVTLELDTDEGRQLFKDLIARADFVAENFAPRVMGKLGLDYDTLKAVKPDIIYCSISGYGHSGPWSPLPAIGGTVEPTAGMSGVLGYEGGPPMNSGQMYPDAVAGLYAFASLALALYHRDRTGKGQYIDVSMQEANMNFVSERMLEYSMAGQVPKPMGNKHTHFAPHNIYPALGEDRWLAIAVETDGQWLVLCDALDLTDLKEQYKNRAARKANEDAIDAKIGAKTASCDRDALATKLSESGVIAAPVLNGLEVAADGVFRSRGAVLETNHPEAGTWPQPAIPCRFSVTPGRVRSAAPIKGAHSAEVFKSILGMNQATFERLEKSGVTGVMPPRERQDK